jgi:hypothetical protein
VHQSRLGCLLSTTLPLGVIIGGFGISLPADDSPTQSLEEIVRTNSWLDPHIGGDRSFAEWVRTAGNRSMLVVPHTAVTRLEVSPGRYCPRRRPTH